MPRIPLRRRGPGETVIDKTVAAVSPLRTACLVGALLVIVMAVIVAVVALVGLGGALAIELGLVTFEELTLPSSVAAVILLGSAVIAVIICALVNITLIRPLRTMTSAMGALARGRFDLRVAEHARFRVREVDDFARGFNRAAEELGGTEMMRAGFISDFSHEFRTPISALSGFAQLLRDDDGLTDDERREYLDIIIEEAGRLSGLSERILMLSKMEATHIMPDVALVDVAETVRRAVAIEGTSAERRGVSFRLALDACTCRGNESYLIQLWTNLLNNAVKFSPDGGSVGVALYGGRTGEEGRGPGGEELVCWISDEGCGMDAVTQKHLFERFYQGDTSHAAEGNGLGLALCKRIVELHGGSIEVDSVPGRGTTFEVRLPLADAGC